VVFELASVWQLFLEPEQVFVLVQVPASHSEQVFLWVAVLWVEAFLPQLAWMVQCVVEARVF
jgi:hypothetical protein